MELKQQRDSNLTASRDSIVSEIQDALELLIIQGKHAWSPFISMWSIKILGVLSQKYKANDNRGRFIGNITFFVHRFTFSLLVFIVPRSLYTWSTHLTKPMQSAYSRFFIHFHNTYEKKIPFDSIT